MEPYVRPTMTPCCHIFCHDCIVKSIKFKKKCPQCRQPVQNDNLTEIVKKIEIKENSNIVTFFDIKNNRREVPKDIHDLYQNAKTSNKINYVINKILGSPKSFIIYSQFNNCLNYLEKILTAKKISVELINGSKSRVQRKKAIEKFQNNQVKVFLLSTKTSSVGLTLTSSYHMIFMEPILDEQIYNQAIGRIYRIGQINNVTIETLYSKGTVENIKNIQNYKDMVTNKNAKTCRQIKMNYLIKSLNIE